MTGCLFRTLAFCYSVRARFPSSVKNMALGAAYVTWDAGCGKSVEVRSPMTTALIDRYCCPDTLLDFNLTGPLSFDAGYFRFGQDTICYGRSGSGYRAGHSRSLLYDVSKDVTTQGASVFLPFNPTEVIDSLRLEHYAKHLLCSDLSRGDVR